jgi:hypothetical protein
LVALVIPVNLHQQYCPPFDGAPDVASVYACPAVPLVPVHFAIPLIVPDGELVIDIVHGTFSYPAP